MLVPTFAPAPSLTALRSPWPCAVPTHEATIANEVRPDLSSADIERAKAMNAKMSAVIRILVGPDGKVQDTRLIKSTGNLTLDVAAMRAARASTFNPKEIDCRPVSGVYRLPFVFALPGP